MGHGSGCFPSGHKKNGHDMYDHRRYQGRVDDGYAVPAYATYDDTLPQVIGASTGVLMHVFIGSMHAKPPAGTQHDQADVSWIMKHRSCWTTSRRWASTLRCTLMGAIGRRPSIAVAASHRMTARRAAGCPTTTP